MIYYLKEYFENWNLWDWSWVIIASAGIDIMIDDSPIYGRYFWDVRTQYIMYTPDIKEFLKLLFYGDKKL